jgi:lactate dehydrogenase-like 2-hydroxyacid dehydrogenase
VARLKGMAARIVEHIRALKTGQLGGLAIDVYGKEADLFFATSHFRVEGAL